VFAIVATPPAKSDFDFCNQIRRSASSAPRNIAEGFGRFWPSEFAHKLRIAKGELEETRDHLLKALEEQYISETTAAEMIRLAKRAIGAATRFLVYLDRNGDAWKKAYLAGLRTRDADARKNPEPGT